MNNNSECTFDLSYYNELFNEAEIEATKILSKKPTRTNWNLLGDYFQSQLGYCTKYNGSLWAAKRQDFSKELVNHFISENDFKFCDIKFNSSGSFLAAAHVDNVLCLWDWHKNICKAQISLIVIERGENLNTYDGRPNALEWLNDDLIVTSDCDGDLKLVDVSTSKVSLLSSLPTYEFADNKISSLHNDSNNILCTSINTVYLIDRRDGTKKHKVLELNSYKDCVYYFDALHSNPMNANEFCVAGNFETLNIYDRRNTSIPLKQLYAPSQITYPFVEYLDLAYNYNGNEILTSCSSNSMFLFNTSKRNGRECIQKYDGHYIHGTGASESLCCFLGSRSEYVVTGSECNNIFVWDKESGALVRMIPGPEVNYRTDKTQNYPRVITSHPSKPCMAISYHDGSLRICEISANARHVEITDLKVQLRDNLRNKMYLNDLRRNLYFDDSDSGSDEEYNQDYL
ncbi:hypothetical protein TKK_0009152 [Trichogramma kaykai]|uniref:WD repeat-containing protein 55 homolog n=1 Tax=Trichogramma kaykai TaxID=54128 RepID=A0ABD2X4Z2_9HYME